MATKTKMKTYLVTYHLTAAAQKKMSARMKKDPAIAKDVMAAWGSWGKRCGKDLVDMGAPLAKGKKISPAGQGDSRRNLTGYSIVRAQNMTALKKLLKNHPHLDAGGDIEVHESMPM